MPNQFLSDEFGDIEDYFVTDYWLIDNFVGDTLFTWGFNSQGQLGDNTTTTRSTPVTTFAGGTTWKQISCGTHTAAIKTDGSLWLWGRNDDYPRLGTNDTLTRTTPVTTFAGGTDWKQVSCGSNHTAAIKTDGSLWLWGRGDNGRLGNLSSTPRTTPVTTFAGGTNWKSVASGGYHTAAIKTDGTLWTWGLGALGTNGSPERNTPVTTFAGGTNWKSVSAGVDFTAAIKTDGSLWLWGQNQYGHLGVNDLTYRNTPVTTFAGGTNWKQISCGGNHTAAIKTDGTLWCWGLNNFGAFGLGFAGGDRRTPVTTFAGGTNWKQVSAGTGSAITAAIKTDGTLWCWGRGAEGQLGNNVASNIFTPITTFAGGNNWKQVSTGNLIQTIAIKSGLNVDLS